MAEAIIIAFGTIITIALIASAVYWVVTHFRKPEDWMR